MLDIKWTKTIPVFLFQPGLFSHVRMTSAVQYLHVIALPYCKMFCMLSGERTGFCQMEGCGGEQRELVSILPNRHQKQHWTENLVLIWQFHGSRAHCWMGKQTHTKSFTLRKTSTLIQEQDHFSFMFPNWSFPQLTPYIASGFPSTFF